MGYGVFHKYCAWISLLLLAGIPGAAEAQQVRITGLTDVAFGPIVNFAADLSVTRNVCVFSSAAGGRYAITATGSGPGGAFTLTSGSARLAYEVQWAGASGQASGVDLRAGVAQTGFAGATTFSDCFFGFLPSASLITILRSNAVNSASAGDYSGTLTLIVAPN